MGMGENWHGNHHHRQSSPRLGYGLAQVDLGWWVIRLLACCGLASQVKSTGCARSESVSTTALPHSVAVTWALRMRAGWRLAVRGLQRLYRLCPA